MIEELIEVIVELAFDGAIEGSKSSKVPMPVRIILKVIIFVIYAALIGLFAFISFVAFRDGEIGMGIFMAVLTVAFTAVSIVKLRQKRKK